jgi:glycerol kinase
MSRKGDLEWLAAELSAIRRQLLPANESPDLVLALDQGSHATRAVLYDAAGREVAQSHVPVNTARTQPDRVEQDPGELAQSVRQAVTDVLSSELVQGRRVASAGLATQRSTIVCFDRRDGTALSPAISWQDRRGQPLIDKLRSIEAKVRRQTGLVLSAHYGASKLRWCLDELPQVQAVQRLGHLGAGPLSTYLLNRLLVEKPAVVDPANASRTLLFDPSRREWSQTLLDAFGIPESALPECVPTSYAYGRIAAESREIPLRVCTGDQSAVVFAFGAPRPDTAYVNIGTGAFVQCAVPPRVRMPDGLLRGVLFSDANHVSASLEGTVNGAGSALEWFREQSDIDPERALPSLPTRAPDDLPLFLNGVGGLGSPFWVPNAPIEFVGRGDDVERLLAILESVAFLIDANLRAIRSVVAIKRVVVTGGLARSDYLCQALADVSGLEIARYAVREATARGVAFLAAGQPAHWPAPDLDRVFEATRRSKLTARAKRWQKALDQRISKKASR